MSPRPLVSIVMPSLNQGEFIRRSIESVLIQDYAPIELIVVDGRSADGTLDILRGYGDRIRWVSEPDGGQTPAINKGFRMTRGEIIGWLNADDLYVPGALSTGVDYLEAHPNVDLVYGAADHIDGDGKFLAPYPTEPFSLSRLREACFICQPAVFFRRRVFEKIGYLDEHYNSSMDYEYWVRIAQHGTIAYHPVRLAASRLHPGAKTRRLRLEHQRLSIELVKQHFGSVPPSWLCAYAGAVVERWLPQRTPWQRRFFLVAVTVVSLWKSVQVNRGVPAGAFKQWRQWLIRTVRRREA